MYSICTLSTDAALTCTICRRISAVGEYISVVGHIYYTTFISYCRCFTCQLAPIHKTAITSSLRLSEEMLLSTKYLFGFGSCAGEKSFLCRLHLSNISYSDGSHV